MRRAQRFVLVADVAFRPEALRYGQQLGLHLGTEIANDEGNLLHGFGAHGNDVFGQALYDGLSADGHQGFGYGERVGAKSAAAAGHGDDDVHGVFSLMGSCASKAAGAPLAFG